MDEVILQKVASIEQCIKRVKEEAAKDWMNNFTYQDALILNIERACQLAIDLAAHVIKSRRLGLSSYSRELFEILQKEGLIDQKISDSLQKMVGFRILVVNDYGKLDL